jgi:chromosome segregation ATPase
MKHLLSAILGLACVALAVSLIVSKRNDNAQHEKDAEAITIGSNQLISAHMEIAACQGTIVNFSNRLEACRSASLTFSNQLVEAKSDLATATEQITNLKTDLNQQITQSESEKQTSSQRIAALTKQIAGLTNQIASTRAGLDQADKNYALLENRFRRDVAERVVVERKFNNLSALKAQMEWLQWDPAKEISADRIYEGLNVVVKSNLCYVIAPE